MDLIIQTLYWISSGLLMRLNCPPEIALHVLSAA